jgi:hypothetical protein
LQRRRPLRKGGARQQSKRNHLTEANAFEHDLAAGGKTFALTQGTFPFCWPSKDGCAFYGRHHSLAAVCLMPEMFTAARIRVVRGQPNSKGRVCPRGGFELDFASKKIYK